MPILVANKWRVLVFLLLSFHSFLFAFKSPIPAPFHAFVRTVIDGDTIKVEHRSELFTIRLAYIDAPELNQRYGLESRRCLQQLVYRQHVFIRPLYHDRYKRLVATVELEKNSIDKILIQLGCAWHLYSYSQSDYLELIQSEAKDSKKGLWSQANPIKPSVFRRLYYYR